MSDEFLNWLLPATLTRRRKIVINVIMFVVLLVLSWLANDPSSPFFVGAF